MTWIYLLYGIGIALIALEVIIPGGILGAIGALSIFGGCAVAYYELGSMGGTIASASVFVVTGIILWLEFRFLPNRAFLTKSITSVSSAYGDDAKTLVGKEAEAMTTLSPSGYVRIEGQRYEAFCQGGHTKAGTALTVVGADNFRLIVAPSSSTDSNSAE